MGSHPLRVALVAAGDPSLQSTNSGVALGFLDALRMRSDVQIVGTINAARWGWRHVFLALLTIRFPLRKWRQAYNRSGLAIRLSSRLRDEALERLPVRPDVVIHIRGNYLPPALPHVAFIDGTASLSQRFWSGWRMSARFLAARERTERLQLADSLVVLAAGQHVAREVIEHYGIDPTKVFTIGGGTNFAELPSPDLARARIRAHADRPFRLLFVGVDFQRKGGPLLLDAFRLARERVPDIELDLIGPKPGNAEPGVNWRGFLRDRELLREFYLAADAFCLPSVYEPYGLVIQEAMLHGLPSIVSDRGELPEIVGHGSAGIVVPAGDAVALSAAILALAESPERRARLGEEAMRRVRGMSWTEVAERAVEAIIEALGRG